MNMRTLEICTLFLALKRRLPRSAAARLEVHGLFLTAPFMLQQVQEQCYPSQIAAALGLQLPTVSQLLRRLEQEGLVARELDPTDRRRFRFALTERGRHALRVGTECMTAALEEQLARLTPAERAIFGALLQKMVMPSKQEQATCEESGG
jgi:DNA-binding MarR family transcriptional regulator